MSAENIVTSFRNGVRKIVINRPERKNALSPKMYQRITDVLNEDAKNDSIVITIITGTGDFYSSGNDLKSAMSSKQPAFDIVKKMIEAFINYPKLIIAVVNGPAIGVAATTVALCDIAYATEKAYFDTPFVKLGLCAEGASSYMFPRILGRSKASEVLFLNKKLTAQEAYSSGFISGVIPQDTLNSFIEGLYKYGGLPVNMVKISKRLIMDNLRIKLTDANDKEIEGLNECYESGEFAELMMTFFQRKSKL